MGQAMTPKGSNTPSARYIDPWQALRSEVDHLFDSVFEGGFPRSRIFESDDKALMPSIDVKEDEARILVEAELPGLDEQDVELTLRDGILTISGEKKFEKSEEKANFHVMERRYGSFQRTLRLPETVDEDAVEATFEKGILKIMLPKKPEAVKHEKKIAIKAG